MLVVKLEIAPGGDRSHSAQVGEMRIGRQGPAPKDSTENCDYTAAIFDAHGERLWAGVVQHKRWMGAWALVKTAIHAAATEVGFSALQTDREAREREERAAQARRDRDAELIAQVNRGTCL